ncbi:hypothetical protein DFH28DRAFT_1071478 [Melampsora americana]|nr:hypothetical protein DFH28DRAFT_1071478 [Melampsora americana]
MTQIKSITESVKELKSIRESGIRKSIRVIELVKGIGYEDANRYLGEDVWDFYEQVAIAALDVKELDLAKRSIERLEKQFPESPRVLVLHGMLLESNGELILAKEFYQSELNKPIDSKSSAKMGNTGETNMRIRKRLIALHLHHSPLPDLENQIKSSDSNPDRRSEFSLDEAIRLLVQHLDTVYSDPESWIQLAETYSTLGLYDQALSALEDLIILQPDNTFHLLRYAETAYTASYFEVAYQTYLRVIEVSEKISDASKGGPARRAAIGIKLVKFEFEFLVDDLKREKKFS